MYEVCSRVYCGNARVLQPACELQNVLVCAACAENCWQNANRANMAVVPMALQRLSNEFTCECRGQGSQGCLFSSQFGTQRDNGGEYRSRLQAKFRKALVLYTLRCLEPLANLSHVLVSSMLHPEPTLVAQRCDAVLTLLRDDSVPLTNRLEDVIRWMDHNFFISWRADIVRQRVNDMLSARTLCGSQVERCMLMAALIHHGLHSSMDDRVRVVFSLDIYGDVHHASVYLQYRMSADSNTWLWLASPVYEGETSTRMPGTAIKERVFFGLYPSGLMEDATTSVTAEGTIYDAATFQSGILERNLSYAQYSSTVLSFTDSERTMIRSGIQAQLASIKDTVGSSLRNLHRAMVSVPSSVSDRSLTDSIMFLNRQYESTTVDNSSLVPLRTYPGESKQVEQFLIQLEHLASASTDNAQCVLDHGACRLISRCLHHWPNEGRTTLLLSLCEMLPGLFRHLGLSDVIQIFGSDNMNVLSVNGYDSASRQVWNVPSRVAILRFVEVLFTTADDHVALLEYCGTTAITIMSSVWSEVERECTNYASIGASETKYPNPELAHQFALTLQAVASSATIASFGDVSDRNNFVHTCRLLVSLEVSALRYTGLSSTFSLVEAADVVFSQPIVAVLEDDDRVMVVDALQLVYSRIPLAELSTIIIRVTTSSE